MGSGGSRPGFVRATEIAALFGQGVAFALGFIGLLYNPILTFIAIFVYLAAASEAHSVALRAMSRGVPGEHRDDGAIRDLDAAGAC
jgi:stage IV sporulation protein FB